MKFYKVTMVIEHFGMSETPTNEEFMRLLRADMTTENDLRMTADVAQIQFQEEEEA